MQDPTPHSQSGNQFEQEINIQELLQVLWKNKLIIAAVTGIVVFMVLIYHFSATPEYRSTSIVLIKNDKGVVTGEMINPFESLTGFELQNDIELIKSFPLAEEVVRDLYQQQDRDSLQLFGERRYVSPLKDLFGGLSFGFGGKEEEEVDFDLKMRTYAEALKKRVSVSNSRDTDILQVSVSSPFPDEAALLTNAICQAYMRKDIEWNADQALSVKDFVSEQLAQQQREIAAVENQLSAYMKNQNIYELTGNAEKLLEKLVEAESRYNDAQSEITILKKRQDFLVQKLSAEEKALSDKIASNVDRQASDLKNRIKQEEKALIDIATQNGTSDPSYVAKRQEVDVLKQRLQELTRNMIAGELAFSSKARQFQFDLISEQLQTDVRLAELDYIAQEYLRAKNYYESQLNRLPQKQLNYARLQRDREVLNNTYTFLKEKLEESRIKIASEVGKVVIVGAAFPPVQPVAPDLKKNLLIGLILGLGLGGALVFVREMLDHSLKDDAFLEDHGFVPLAAVPYVAREGETLQGSLQKSVDDVRKLLPSFNGNGTSGKHQKQNSQGKPVASSSKRPPLLMADSLSSPFAEAFRDLRTNIIFSQADRKVKSILVTGTEISEGKSTVCSNLAFAFALTGKRVLIVDCDMRRPSQHRMLNTLRMPGLSDYLAGVETDLEEILQPTMHENLWLLPSGSTTPSPNELLGSNKMTELVEKLEEEWDYVILDTPPVLLLSDATLLSRAADGILMVVRMGYTNKNLLKEVQKLDYLKKTMLGVAIIGPSEKSGYYKYGRYYGRYGYKGYYSYKSYSSYLEPEKNKG
ncbi:polysaccharide biosynthesis tyrosine autokinase [Prosthecochloris sp. HL-130-GSB]|uniref:GumC family protein n=1 Tax=Prosthecochloris sp. HL-130-GSB TaxID=1974213 RepID=UPI000A1C0692|nr:polysaccharide biosynthesis tyrosine autokinase [Prosthecochloris sp. HL-130-GSB]ARM31382.1 capsular biosynthesis protein [Prosthecochloris sp. HL-130-GSB]